MARTWTLIEDVFPTENGDIPASYVSLPEGKQEHGGKYFIGALCFREKQIPWHSGGWS